MKIRVRIIWSVLSLITVFAVNNTASAQQISDKSLKKNAAPVTNSLNFITQLNPVSYEYDQEKFKQLNLPAGKHYGFIAEDVQQVLPTAVVADSKWYTIGKNNPRAVTTPHVDLEKLVPLLVGAVKEQQEEINKLKSEIERLKKIGFLIPYKSAAP